MFKFNLIFVIFCCSLFIHNSYTHPARQNARKDQNQFNLFDPDYWSSLFDDIVGSDDEESESVTEKSRPVVVCSPPNCTIVINVQNGSHIPGTMSKPNVPPNFGGIPPKGSGYAEPAQSGPNFGGIPPKGSGYAEPAQNGVLAHPPAIPPKGSGYNTAHGGIPAEAPGHNVAPNTGLGGVMTAGHNVAPGTQNIHANARAQSPSNP